MNATVGVRSEIGVQTELYKMHMKPRPYEPSLDHIVPEFML